MRTSATQWTHRVNSNNTLVSFKVVSLFAEVPIRDALILLRRLCVGDSIGLYHVPTFSFLCFNGQFCENNGRNICGFPIIVCFCRLLCEELQRRRTQEVQSISLSAGSGRAIKKQIPDLVT